MIVHRRFTYVEQLGLCGKEHISQAGIVCIVLLQFTDTVVLSDVIDYEDIQMFSCQLNGSKLAYLAGNILNTRRERLVRQIAIRA